MTWSYHGSQQGGKAVGAVLVATTLLLMAPLRAANSPATPAQGKSATPALAPAAPAPSSPAAPAEVATPATPVLPPPPAPGVVATINGQNITREELTRILLKEYGSPALERLIDRRVLDQAAQKQGIEVTPKDLDLMYGALRVQASQTVDNYERQYGHDYVLENVARPQFIIMKLGEKLVKPDMSQFDEVRASHILIRPDSSTAEAGRQKADAAARQKAEQVLAEVKAPGADFAALARKYSADTTSALKGGDLDFFTKGRMMPEFEAAAFSAKPGDIVGPVKTLYGYHIIKITDRRDASSLSPAELEAKLLSYYRTNAGEPIQSWINRQRQEAKIQRYSLDDATTPSTPAPAAP